MGTLDRLKRRIPDANEQDLEDCILCARETYFKRRFPYSDWPDDVEKQYQSWIYRAAIDLYNKAGAEGENRHVENGVTREYDGSWISAQLLNEIIPMAGVLK